MIMGAGRLRSTPKHSTTGVLRAILRLCSRELLATEPAIPAPRSCLHVCSMTNAPADPLDIVRAVRDARFTNGHFCPRCRSRHVIRWGGFSGRRRYRCKMCNRTFSDLTQTALAYGKCVGKWPHYLVLMRQSRTLRVAAAQLGIHVSTAFRWRHAILSLGREADVATLNGTVEMKEILFAHSRKGCRDVATARQRGARTGGWRWNQVPRDRVLLAFSREGVPHSSTVGGDVAVIDAIHRWTIARLNGRCTVLSYSPRAGPLGSIIRATGHDYRMLRMIDNPDKLTGHHVRNVDAYGRRLLDWLRPFRGVASRYRDNYLYWHQRVDGDYDLMWVRRLTVDAARPAYEPTATACSGRGSRVDPPP